MEKIKNLKNKINFENIFIVYIILQPIIDIITSLCVRHLSEQLTLGIFVRAFFMVCLIIYTLFKANKKDKWKILIYYSLIFIYCIAFLVNSYLKFGFSLIFTQIKGLIKTFYFPIILASLLILLKEKKYTSKIKYLNISLAIYVLTIVVCKIFSVGYATYPLKGNSGTIGLFYAGNEISATIAMLSPLCFGLFISQKFNIFNAILCVLSVFAMLEIGTKVAFISIIVLLIISLIFSIINLFKNDTKQFCKQFATLVIIVTLTFLFLGYTSGGKNVGIKPISFVKEEVPHRSDDYYTVRPVEPAKTDVLSGRSKFLANNIKKYNSGTILDKSVGLGYTAESKNVVKERKLVEIDYCDILFCHGVIGTIIYAIPLIAVIYISIKKFFTNFVINITNQKLLLIIYAILIGFGIALMAGHVFTAPAVSMFLVLVILELFIMLYERDKNNE